MSVVMAGVMPPPVHGQSLVTKTLFEADLSPVSKELVPIRSSLEISAVGKFSLSKVLGLPGIIVSILKARFRSGARVLYYTAGSAAFVPFMRDLVVLSAVRPFFRRTLIHYHSGGLPDFLNASPVRRQLGRWIYGNGAWSLSLSRHTAVPGVDFGAERVVEIPNGVSLPENFEIPPRSADGRPELKLAFIGNLYEDKGIFDLLAAAKLAAASSPVKLSLSIAGKWASDATRQQFGKEMESLPEGLSVEEPAPRYGDEKWKLLQQADIFLFPTYYRNENLPLVVIEAMAASLPVIAYRWRGLPSLVEERSTGLLVEPHDIQGLAEAILVLANDAERRLSMGRAGRATYQVRLTTEVQIELIRETFMAAYD